MQQINWGIIGCGNVTEKKSGPAFGKIEGSRVVAVMRRDALKAEDYARRHGIPTWYSNAEDLINDPLVNAVYIATPPSSHADYAIRVMEKGKFTYVEKPMAASYKECVSMYKASVGTGIPLYVAYYRRFLPYFQKVKSILEGGDLGELQFGLIDFQVPARPEDFIRDALPWSVLPEIAGAGYFYDLACHQIDLFDWFFGKVRKATGQVYNRRGLYRAEDLVFGQIEYESGFPVTGTWCFTSDPGQNTDLIRIHGTKATLEFSTFAFTSIKLIAATGTTEFLPPNPENIQFWLIKNMVEELQTPVKAKGNAEAAMRTNLIMDEMLSKS